MTRGERQVEIDRLVAAHGLTERDPGGEEPDFASNARIWTLDSDLRYSPSWQWADCVPWREVIAYRAEDDLGRPIQPMDWDQYGDDLDE